MRGLIILIALLVSAPALADIISSKHRFDIARKNLSEIEVGKTEPIYVGGTIWSCQGTHSDALKGLLICYLKEVPKIFVMANVTCHDQGDSAMFMINNSDTQGVLVELLCK